LMRRNESRHAVVMRDGAPIDEIIHTQKSATKKESPGAAVGTRGKIQNRSIRERPRSTSLE
jgi:hypothetical protein